MITCVLNPEKKRSRDLCFNFAMGVGRMARIRIAEGFPHDAPLRSALFFYGVSPENKWLLDKARREGVTWFYSDNAYFDRVRGTHFRITRNALQATTLLTPDYVSMSRQGIAVEPWRTSGKKILVCQQSEFYMRILCGYGGGIVGWTDRVVRKLRQHTDRPIEVRHWDNHKKLKAREYAVALEDAWAVVVHTSAAANEALLRGVPVFTTGECAATPLASGDLSNIENPSRPDNRKEWAAGLCGRQWTLPEIAAGLAWSKLNGMG